MFYKAAPLKRESSSDKGAFPPPLEEQISVSKTDDLYLVITPIRYEQSVIGTLAISYSKTELSDIRQQYGLIFSLLLLSGVLGWLILYLLLCQLSKPMDEVVQALK